MPQPGPVQPESDLAFLHRSVDIPPPVPDGGGKPPKKPTDGEKGDGEGEGDGDDAAKKKPKEPKAPKAPDDDHFYKSMGKVRQRDAASRMFRAGGISEWAARQSSRAGHILSQDTASGAAGASAEAAGSSTVALEKKLGLGGGRLEKGTKAIADIFEAITDGVGKLRNWNDEILKGNLQFKEFSSKMAQVAAAQEIADIQLSQERGERLATTAGFQQRGRQHFEQGITQWDDLWNSGRNILSGVASELGAAILAPFAPMAGPLQRYLDTLVGGDNDNKTGKDWLDDAIDRANQDQAWGKPRRFPGGRNGG